MIKNMHNTDLELNNEEKEVIVEDKKLTTIAEDRNSLDTLRDYFEDNGLLTEEILEKLDSLTLSLKSSKKMPQRNLLDFFK